MLKKIGLGLVAIIIICQFFQISKTNPTSDPKLDIIAQLNPPAEVAKLLRDACYDCHSNETKYPWYTYLNPVGWWIGNHIKHGRKHANYSEWGNYSKDDQEELLEESSEHIKDKKMPLGSYTWTHPEARLTDAQKTLLINWFDNQPSDETPTEN